MGALVQGRRMSDYDRGYHYFRMGDDLPVLPPRAMVDGYNKCRAEALRYQTSVALNVLRESGRDISDLHDAVAEMVAKKCAPKSVYSYNGNDIEEDVGSERARRMAKMQRWYRSPTGSGACVLTKPEPIG